MQPLPLRFREAGLDDAIALWRVQRRAIASLVAYDRAQRRAWLASTSPEQLARTLTGRLTVVCDVRGRPGGFGQLDVERGRITALYVLPSCKRRGIGDALLGWLVVLAEHARLTSLTLQSSTSATAFYRRHGFADVAPRALTMPAAPALEVLEMRRSLLDSPATW